MKIKFYNRQFWVLALSMAFSFQFALAKEEFEEYDDDDEYTRLNPDEAQLAESATEPENVKDTVPHSYLRRDLNKIQLNGDNWDELKNKLEQSRSHTSFTIVHVGDSHIQGDGGTGTTRGLFQKEYGDAGRGVIIPFKLAGTNEPRDYKITTSAPLTIGKIMKRPWPVEMSFTGITLRPKTSDFTFDIGVKDNIGYFNILSSGSPEVVEVLSNGRPIQFSTAQVKGGVEVYLDEDCSDLTVRMRGDDVNIFGFDLRNDNPGVIYHAVGNNGAAFASYNNIDDFAPSLAALEPDLIILSMGGNEAFGNQSDEAFVGTIDTMVKNIREAMPTAKILITTPAECMRSVAGGKGRGKSYQINRRVVHLRDLILEYGAANNIPTYDFYEVAGGDGSSTKWVADKLLAADRIHRTWDGYTVDGTLVYEALRDALQK